MTTKDLKSTPKYLKSAPKDLRSIPVILMNNVPLPGLEEQIILIHKESSINAVQYVIDHLNGHIIIGLNHDVSLGENLEKSKIYGGILCKILNKFEYNNDKKNQIKILLSIKTRVNFTEIEEINDDTNLTGSFSCTTINSDSCDNKEYFIENIIKISKFDFFEKDLVNNTNNYFDNEEIESKINDLMYKFKNYLQVYGSPHIYNNIHNINNNSKKIDKIASEFTLSNTELFELLTEFNLPTRIDIVARIIDKELLKHQLSKTIDEKVRDHVEKTQKIYLLNEKAKVISKELETLSGETNDLELMEKKLSELKLKDNVRKKINIELRRLKLMSPNSSDAAVIKNYLDWIFDLPWDIVTSMKKEFSEVFKSLNEEHYGMEKVKERILEYLAISFRHGSTPKAALLLVGPPGVGKTSLSRKIAEALGRKFVRLSLGGIRDEADIRGHRRTYLGSLPGKIIQSIRDAGTMNPIILLDEIDKIGHDFRGDPAAALLEVLDKEQNHDFLDHYLDVPFDLSQVLFLCTANTLDISQPLLDRMEIISLSSYSDDEKIKIAKDYMIPKQKKEHGLKPEEIIIDDKVIQTIINRYTYEAGVRGLEEQISMLMRKSLLKILNENHPLPILINKDTIKDFLGLPSYLRDLHKDNNIPGIVNGLAWNSLGGDVLTIECVAIANDNDNENANNGSIKYTGKLGEVMQESIQAAFSYIKANREEFNIETKTYKNSEIHIHVPEGGIPKDGPSAGITIFTALISLLLKKPIRSDVAMTGEITLRGRVLPIGGLKEKLLAAKRNGIIRVLIPFENERELEEIPALLKEGLEVILIENAREILQYAFKEDK